MVKKRSNNSSRRKSRSKSKVLPWPLRRARLGLAILAAVALTQFMLSFTPERFVPEKLRPIHDQMVGFRNSLIRRSGLPISTYVDSYVIDLGTGAGERVNAYFAPAPGIDNALAAFIDRAEKAVDACVYDLDLTVVVAALVRAKERGADVRVITDTDNLSLPELEPLRQAGVALIGDNRRPIMHNKFVVTDYENVWMGSFNFTRNGALKNDNNALVFNSVQLAANYIVEFNEMWRGDFGRDGDIATPYPTIHIGSATLENYFAPDNQVMDHILDLVANARTSIEVMAFAFTDKRLAALLQKKSESGVKVRCLFDRRQARGKFSSFNDLKRAKLATLSPNKYGVMHHKVIIIDNDIVITGSFNFSKNADKRNDENVLVIHCPTLAKIYQDEFNRCRRGLKGY